MLQGVVNGTWSKENRLDELKIELAAIERKIQLSITHEVKEEEKVDIEAPVILSNHDNIVSRSRRL